MLANVKLSAGSPFRFKSMPRVLPAAGFFVRFGEVT
jgi:hypothetical protein